MNLTEFRASAGTALGADLSPDSSHGVLLHEEPRNLYIPAGAGTGKTTGLALLSLKALFVDGHPSDSIVATTFTRKAAAELHSRITRGVMYLARETGRRLDEPALDVAAMRIGTIDDLCNQALVELQLGALIDAIVQNGRMRDAVFRSTGGFRKAAPERQQVVSYLAGLFREPRDVSSVRAAAITLRERLGHDRIDEDAWARAEPDAQGVKEMIARYREALAQADQMDFVQLEERFYDELAGGRLAVWLESVRVLLVDEYQDTNLLQEAIYKRIARRAVSEGGWFALVGDDDQSLFRFRGATVDLFVNARARYRSSLVTVPLAVNRRSTKSIVAFANKFLGIDPDYAPARARGKGPLVEDSNRRRWQTTDSVPVLGIFRETPDKLSGALADAVQSLIGGGWTVPGGTVNVTQPGDIAVIAPTTQAITESSGKTRRQIYSHLADDLQHRGIKFFNPRGTRLADVPEVGLLLGLALLCLDPNEDHRPNFVYRQVQAHFDRWRDLARTHIGRSPEPRRPHTLARFVRAWQRREPQGRRATWPREFPLMELLHELTVWIPELRDSAGFLYIEALTRALEQVGTLLGPWATLVSRDRWDQSVRRFYNEFLTPVAMDEIELDEEVLEVLPADSVNALTIHQAKGLQFPVCFVDVASRFRSAHWRQAFARFPRSDVMDPYTLEDALRPFSDGLAPPTRSARDRAFDDLIRAFYVAFTRAEHVLILFGLGDRENGPNPIENVGTGWSRAGHNHWKDLGVELL